MCQPAQAELGQGRQWVSLRRPCAGLAQFARRSCRLHTSLSTKHVHIDINIQYRLKMDFSFLFWLQDIAVEVFGKILCEYQNYMDL